MFKLDPWLIRDLEESRARPSRAEVTGYRLFLFISISSIATLALLFIYMINFSILLLLPSSARIN
jgi:hypothetical protein